MLLRPNSESVFASACEAIPSGVNSPVRSFPGLDKTPLIVEKGHGDLIEDVDGHIYIDYCGSWGALIHGHAHPVIVKAAQERIAKGSSFGIATESEERLAHKIKRLIPSIEKIRFVSSGTEATMSAARLARAFTKRQLIVKFAGHYHGHADSFLVQAGSGVVHLSATSSSAGVPDDFIRNTLCLPFNDFEALSSLFKEKGSEIAAVILEPIAANMGVVLPEKGFLEKLREVTIANGTLLIFDEVITGFRVACGGAQELYQITPDLTCLGKIIGGGFPAAAFGGRKEVMDLLAPKGPVYQAGTLSGNPVAMEAGYQALLLLEQPGFYEKLEEKMELLLAPLEDWIKRKEAPFSIARAGSMFTIFFGCKSVRNFEEAKGADFSAFKSFFQSFFDKGIYFSPAQQEAHFLSSAHTHRHIEFTAKTLLEYFSQVYS